MCIYLIHLKDNDYKYGRSVSVNDRIDTHISKFEKLGCGPYVVKCWACESAEIMNKVETMITRFAKDRRILADPEKYKQREIITTDDIDMVISAIDKYIDRENQKCERITDNKKLELEIAKIQAETAKIQATERLYGLKMQLEPPRSIQQIPPVQISPPVVMHPLHTIKAPPTSEVRPLTTSSTDDEFEPEETSLDAPVIDTMNKQRMVHAEDRQSASTSDALPDNSQPVINNVVVVPTTQPLINTTALVLVNKTPTRRHQMTVDWVKTNPPVLHEITTAYYKRYADSVQKPLANKTFEPIVKTTLGRKPVKISSNKRRW